MPNDDAMAKSESVYVRAYLRAVRGPSSRAAGRNMGSRLRKGSCRIYRMVGLHGRRPWGLRE